MSATARLWRSVALTTAAACLATASASENASIQQLRDQALAHERNSEWDKALGIYSTLLRNGNNPQIQDRYQNSLRRYWQSARHQDVSFRKEVLGLDYGQALRLYNKIRDTLLDNALDKKRIDPSRLLQKGIEELDAALANPFFKEQHLPGKQAETLAFRDHLKRKFAVQGPMSRAQVEQQIREIALTAQDMLQLSPTVSILELACGANYAIDNYTAYLTPDQFRELCDALKGETTDGVMIRSVLAELKGDLGYIRILSFQDTTLQDLDDSLSQLAKAGAKGLILDVRGNPGGLIEVAIEATKRFLSSGIIATVENQDPKFSTVYQARNPASCTLPLILLVDSDTASAAEVFAGALKENGRARLIGQKTFGKGCTQSLVKLPAANGVPTGGLRVTVARFFSPKGHAYTDRGVTPDTVVAGDKPEMMDGIDQQLLAAVNDLQRHFMMMR